MANPLIATIETALNRYLDCDESSKRRLEKAVGKSLKVTLKPLNIHFVVHVLEDRVKLTSDDCQEATTTITGTPLQLLGAFVDKRNRQQFFADDLHIEGNAIFAQQIIDLFNHVEIDWEEVLAQKIGDVPAYKISKFIQRSKKWLGKRSDAFRNDMTDYLHEEKQWFPTREALNEFFEDIDELRMDTDRLKSRIDTLKATMHKEEKS